MDIHKLIKEDKKVHKTFIIIMIIIVVVCPFTLMLAGLNNTFFIVYLFFVEFLAVFAILHKVNTYNLEFKLINNKIKYKSGIFSKYNILICDRITLVHTEGVGNNMELVLVSTISLKSTYLKPITKGFYKKYPSIISKINAITKMDNNTILYYTTIKAGSLKKYYLLDIIYKNCVKAKYTDEAIENIKIARGQKKLKI